MAPSRTPPLPSLCTAVALTRGCRGRIQRGAVLPARPPTIRRHGPAAARPRTAAPYARHARRRRRGGRRAQPANPATDRRRASIPSASMHAWAGLKGNSASSTRCSCGARCWRNTSRSGSARTADSRRSRCCSGTTRRTWTSSLCSSCASGLRYVFAFPPMLP